MFSFSLSNWNYPWRCSWSDSSTRGFRNSWGACPRYIRTSARSSNCRNGIGSTSSSCRRDSCACCWNSLNRRIRSWTLTCHLSQLHRLKTFKKLLWIFTDFVFPVHANASIFMTVICWRVYACSTMTFLFSQNHICSCSKLLESPTNEKKASNN